MAYRILFLILAALGGLVWGIFSVFLYSIPGAGSKGIDAWTALTLALPGTLGIHTTEFLIPNPAGGIGWPVPFSVFYGVAILWIILWGIKKLFTRFNNKR